MTRVSRVKLTEKKLKEFEDNFSYLISSLNNKDEIHNFFDNFFTKEEKIMFVKRLILFIMLKRDHPPTIIQQLLGISYETVRTYRNQFVFKDNAFQKVIEKLIAREQTKDFLRKIDKILKPLDLMLRAKSDMKVRAKFASGDWD